MFSSPFAANRPHAMNAYHRTALEVRAAEADPHQLVSMLFDGFFEAVSMARGALRSGDVSARGKAIGRAVSIVDEGLRGALDLKHGGPLARDLHDLYSYVTMRLTRANLTSDEAGLAECMALLQPLAEAWAAIRPQAVPATRSGA